jgi:hypothetical protein
MGVCLAGVAAGRGAIGGRLSMHHTCTSPCAAWLDRHRHRDDRGRGSGGGEADHEPAAGEGRAWCRGRWCQRKRVSTDPTLVWPMQEPWSIEKIMEIDSHIGCAMSGLVADAKMLVDHARAETQVRHRGTSALAPCRPRPAEHASLCMYMPAATPLLLQRGHAGGERDAEPVRSSAAIWRGLRRGGRPGGWTRAISTPYHRGSVEGRDRGTGTPCAVISLMAPHGNTRNTRGLASCMPPFPPAQSRPFGVALLLAGWDDNGPAL